MHTAPVHSPKKAWKILVTEDDDELREEILVPCLSDAGFEVTAVANTREMYKQLLVGEVDLVLLDIGLPDEDGFSALEHLKKAQVRNVVMLTGHYSTQERLRSLYLGVDAHLPKPVDVSILIATLNNVLQRSTANAPMTPTPVDDAQQASPKELEVSPSWQIDHKSWHMTAPNGNDIALNPQERVIVNLLWASRGQVVKRDTLIEHLSQDYHDFDPHRLEVIVHRLRKKVLESTGMPLPVNTVRNLGYVFN